MKLITIINSAVLFAAISTSVSAQSASAGAGSQTNGSAQVGQTKASGSANEQVDAKATRKKGSASANSNQSGAASAQAGGANLGLDSGSRIDATLANSLDTKNAREGQPFKMKVNKDVKSGGQTVIKKGSTLVGHVTRAQSKAEGNGTSNLTLALDGVQQGGSVIPLQANFVGVIQQSVSSAADTGIQSAPLPSSGGGGRSGGGGGLLGGGGGGGLLGGVGSTVNSTVSTTTRATGNVAGNAGGSVGSTVGSTVNGTVAGAGNIAAGGALNGATTSVFSLGNGITASTSSAVQGATQFSRQGHDLKLDQGTNFILAVAGQGTVTRQ